jgi:hypothetical protein
MAINLVLVGKVPMVVTVRPSITQQITMAFKSCGVQLRAIAPVEMSCDAFIMGDTIGSMEVVDSTAGS